jgi:NADP-dependent aldehyde dehydrogenase
MLYDAGIEIGAALVKHPHVAAVAFTGSLRAGRALMDLAAARPNPIPCFTEMSSGNPVFVLPSALHKSPKEVAKNLFGSFTLGAGQFCTKPGIVFLPPADLAADTDRASDFELELAGHVDLAESSFLLTAGIAREYSRATQERESQVFLAANSRLPQADSKFAARAKLFRTTIDNFLGQPELADEIFGPDTLLIRCSKPGDYVRAARELSGHLTATVLGDEDDLLAHRELLEVLEQKAGRVLINGFPTGVEVTHAMVHGGPYPSTSDPRFTSVGTQAIYRFAKPVCYQNFPQKLLPAELQDANPQGISRLRNGKPE